MGKRATLMVATNRISARGSNITKSRPSPGLRMTEPNYAADGMHTLTSIDDVDTLTTTLLTIVDWRDELQRKIDRAALRFEFCGLDPDEQEILTRDVECFLQICRSLADSISGSAV